MSESAPSLSILLTNDDGIYADGLWAMHQALIESGHRVAVVAPDRERSAVGHGLTFHQPIKAKQVRVNSEQGWAVAGTPADCVKLALSELLPDRPDMVVTGINPGANVGINLNYSGTVAAAREATLSGLKAIAVSVQYAHQPRYETAARFAARLTRMVQVQSLAAGTFLNVNVPDRSAETIAGVRLGRQGNGGSDEAFEKRRDPRDQTYYWYGCQLERKMPLSDTDDALLKDGYITITPVRCDMTDYDFLDRMRTWGIERNSAR